MYDFLLFSLSVAGRAPMAGRIVSAERIAPELVQVEIERGHRLQIGAKKIYFVEPEVDEHKTVVLDWIDVRRGQNHNEAQIKGDTDFVKHIYFYPSDRTTGSSSAGLKDVASISYLTREQLSSPNYSEFIVRKRVKQMMELAGIRGPKNGKDPNNPTKQKYYSIRLESRKREVYPLVISKPELPTISSTSQGAYLSQANRWISDFNGTTA